MSRSMQWVKHAIFIGLAMLFMAPLYFAVINGIKSPRDFYMTDIWAWPSTSQFMDNVRYAFVEGGIQIGFFNSILYGVAGAVLAIFLAAAAGYALTALEIRGRFFWFLVIYSGAIFPVQMYLIPVFKLFSEFSLYDTKLGLILFYTSISIPFCLFVLRNYFTTFSKDIIEAARLDGSSNFRIFIQIFIPLAYPPISLLFLFQFTYIWNELLFGMTLSRSDSVRPVMAGLAKLQGVYSTVNVPSVILAALLVSIPTLLLFVFLQKHFMQGLVIVEKK